MIGLDTNVLLRFVLGDDPFQARVAERVIREVCTPKRRGFVSLVVVAEFVWALEKAYSLQRETVVLALQLLLSLETLEVQAFEQVYFALEEFEQGKLDFHDALIGFLSQGNSCETTLTFDRKAAGAEAFTRLPARPSHG